MIVRSYVKKADFDAVRIDFLTFHEHPTWIQLAKPASVAGDYVFSIMVKNHAEKLGASNHPKAALLPSPGNPNPLDPALLALFPEIKTALAANPNATGYHLLAALAKANGGHHLLDPDV